jgi:hypothetical protein
MPGVLCSGQVCASGIARRPAAQLVRRYGFQGDSASWPGSRSEDRPVSRPGQTQLSGISFIGDEVHLPRLATRQYKFAGFCAAFGPLSSAVQRVEHGKSRRALSGYGSAAIFCLGFPLLQAIGRR